MIYYSHVNEDNRVENQCLESVNCSNLFCVAGSGERLIALLDKASLKNVFVIDVNEEALFLSNLKVIALQQLSVNDYLFFIGASKGLDKDRLALFYKLTRYLPAACSYYWEQNLDKIAKGILYSGHFENFLAQVRPWLKPILGQSFYQLFEDHGKELRRFPALRWMTLKLLFRQQLTYQLFGNKDPAFRSRDANLKLIPMAIDQTIANHTFQESFMNHLIFLGDLTSLPESRLPLSVSPGFLLKVQKILPKIHIQYVHKDALEAIRNTDVRFFSEAFFSLSDLLSFETPAYVRKLLDQIKAKSKKSNKIVLRSFVRNRLSRQMVQEYLTTIGRVKDLSSGECTAMYQVFEISVKNEK